MNGTESETESVSSVRLCKDPYSFSLSTIVISWSLLNYSLGFLNPVADGEEDHHLPEWAGKKHSTY